MKLNVVMLCDFFDPELGYQESVLQKSFLSRGHSCSVICAPKMNIFDYYQGKKAPHAKTQSAGNIHRCDYLFRFRSLKLLRGIRSKLEELKPNLLFVHDINLSLLVAMLYVRKNPECVLICDNHCDESNSAKSFISKLVVYKLIKRCIVWIASHMVKRFYGVTPSCIEFMTRMLGVPERKTQLLPLCVNSIDFGEGLSGEKIKELRLGFDIPSDHFVVFTGGKLNELKRTHVLIDAVNERADVTLLICGAPESVEYGNELRRLAAGNKSIKFLGWQNLENIYSYMMCSDVGIFPGSQSVMWQQAIGAGLPILVGIGSHDGPNKTQDISYMCKYDAIRVLDENTSFSEQINQYISKLKDNPEVHMQSVKAAKATANNVLAYDHYIKEMESWWTV